MREMLAVTVVRCVRADYQEPMRMKPALRNAGCFHWAQEKAAWTSPRRHFLGQQLASGCYLGAGANQTARCRSRGTGRGALFALSYGATGRVLPGFGKKFRTLRASLCRYLMSPRFPPELFDIINAVRYYSWNDPQLP
jgi:hypothetical protein